MRAIEADHVDPTSKMTKTRKDKTVVTVSLSAYYEWTALGGPAAMWNEKKKCVARCSVCHTLQPTGSAGHRVATREAFEAMPCGSQNKNATDEENKQYHAKWHASVTWPRYAYVDSIKLAIGCCQNAACPRDGEACGDVTRPYVTCFDFDHLVEARKECGVSKICSEGRLRPEAEWKAEIQKEVRKCRLLCRNCHHERTHKNLQIIHRDDATSGLTDDEHDE